MTLTTWLYHLFRVPGLWIVLVASVQQFTWAVLMIGTGDEHFTTAKALLHDMVPNPYLLGVILCGVVVAAGVGMQLEIRGRVRAGVNWLLPQLFVVVVSAGAAGKAMIESEFADGVKRQRAFIIADQEIAVLLALAYFGVMVYMATHPVKQVNLE